jgi:hypothetical protein
MMKQIRLRVILLIFFGIFFHINSANADMLYSGEKLTYRVSYLGITLGYIKINTEKQEMYDGAECFVTNAYMKSNPNIPFVDLQAIYKSWIDPVGAFSRQFIGKVKIEDGTWDYHHITFDYARKKIHSKKWIHKEVFFDKTFLTDIKSNDGLSLFFFARKFTKTNKYTRTQTIVDRDTTFTMINFTNQKTISEIGAVNYKVKTVYFNGKADWTGIYGITGEFEGWFSDDDASIPIRAKMKVYIGSVNIELVEWSRGYWMPPKAE